MNSDRLPRDKEGTRSIEERSTERGDVDTLPVATAAVGPRPYRALAIGALAFGALAVGALAIGRLGIGRLDIGRSRIRRLEIEDLDVKRMRVHELLIVDGPATWARNTPRNG